MEHRWHSPWFWLVVGGTDLVMSWGLRRVAGESFECLVTFRRSKSAWREVDQTLFVFISRSFQYICVMLDFGCTAQWVLIHTDNIKALDCLISPACIKLDVYRDFVYRNHGRAKGRIEGTKTHICNINCEAIVKRIIGCEGFFSCLEIKKPW